MSQDPAPLDPEEFSSKNANEATLSRGRDVLQRLVHELFSLPSENDVNGGGCASCCNRVVERVLKAPTQVSQHSKPAPTKTPGFKRRFQLLEAAPLHNGRYAPLPPGETHFPRTKPLPPAVKPMTKWEKYAKVRLRWRCKLDPGLKAPGFITKVHNLMKQKLAT